MRIILPLFLSLILLPACGSDDDPPGDDDDDDDNAGADAGDVGSDLPPPEQGFQIVTEDIVLAAGEEATWCYYTTLPADAEVGVNRWESRMTPGSHHMIMYFTSSPQQADGTLIEDCNIGGGGFNTPIWAYASQTIDGDQMMPSGVGMTVAQNQPAIIQMHYLNTTDSELTAHVTINGHTYPEGMQYERAQPFITYHTGINVPPQSTGSVSGTCTVPNGAQFFLMSTHSHKFSTKVTVTDGSDMVLETTDWEDPETIEWQAAPHFQFQTSLTYTCEYNNTSNQTLRTGDSAETDEMCMAVGYFFPATQPRFCLNSQTF